MKTGESDRFAMDKTRAFEKAEGIPLEIEYRNSMTPKNTPGKADARIKRRGKAPVSTS